MNFVYERVLSWKGVPDIDCSPATTSGLSWVTSQLDRMEDCKGAVKAFENSDGFVE